MKKIKLTQGLYATIDNEDHERISQFKWCAKDDRNGFYAIRGLKKADGKWTTQRMQRFLMDCPEDKIVDHRNRDTLDNRKRNLRVVTHTQNMQNCKMKKNNSSGYKGVQKYGLKWKAKISIDGVVKELGVFIDPIDASKAYNKAAKKFFGEYAVSN